jgi:peptide/nickel transport system ATP-binding protein
MASGATALVDVAELQVAFDDALGRIHAVNDVSFRVSEGQTVALVGESGCGKSVTAMSLGRLLPESSAHYLGGRIRVAGKDVLEGRCPAGLRGRSVAYIFQDPGTSLNPYLTVGYQLCEAIKLHQGRGVDVGAVALALLDDVGIAGGEERLRAYPHQFSGGMQQRVMIAMALACNPALLVADEPTTALDVTTQGQILRLLRTIQKKRGMAVLLITHNLGIVAGVADWVYVMYAGYIVEDGPVSELLRHPAHPYTAGLVAAVPSLSAPDGTVAGIPGSVPDPRRPVAGCPFAPRCPLAENRCLDVLPDRVPREHGCGVRCWHSLSPGQTLTFKGVDSE